METNTPLDTRRISLGLPNSSPFDPVKCDQEHGLIESLIALERQADKMRQFIAEEVSRCAGSTPKQWLATTCKAIANDVTTLQDLRGACEWSEEKRRKAAATLSDLDADAKK
jgi:hypothetical protein